MKEVFTMWKSTKMIILCALTAAIYAAFLIPFKALPIIPGFTEFRPGNLVPVAFALFFGPAAAWGAAIGNTIADILGGTVSFGSLFGFVGNFLYAYVPYKLWDNLSVLGSDNSPDLKGSKKVVLYIIVVTVGSCACGLFIAWGVDMIGYVPFAALGSIIPVNNSIAAIVLGMPITILLYPRIKKWDLYWKDVMSKEHLPHGGSLAKVGAYAMVWFSIAGLIISLFVAYGSGQVAFYFGNGQTNLFNVVITAGVSSIGILVSGAIQN